MGGNASYPKPIIVSKAGSLRGVDIDSSLDALQGSRGYQSIDVPRTDSRSLRMRVVSTRGYNSAVRGVWAVKVFILIRLSYCNRCTGQKLKSVDNLAEYAERLCIHRGDVHPAGRIWLA